jgi:hypothetical protein
MQDNTVTTTLLHAILKNQHAITDALLTLADFVEKLEQQGSGVVAQAVRRSVQTVDDSKLVVGLCISELMRDSRLQ